MTEQDIYDRFSFLEGVVNEYYYRKIAEEAILIYKDRTPDLTDDDIWEIAKSPECHNGGDIAHSVDPIPFARRLISKLRAPVAGEALGWRVRERRGRDGELLDCFVEAPAAPGMAYAQEVLGDDYAEAQGGIQGKLKHCQMIVAWASAAPRASDVS